jgi:hypothetical protein
MMIQGCGGGCFGPLGPGAVDRSSETAESNDELDLSNDGIMFRLCGV